jgi:hypothetical protein
MPQQGVGALPGTPTPMSGREDAAPHAREADMVPPMAASGSRGSPFSRFRAPSSHVAEGDGDAANAGREVCGATGDPVGLGQAATDQVQEEAQQPVESGVRAQPSPFSVVVSRGKLSAAVAPTSLPPVEAQARQYKSSQEGAFGRYSETNHAPVAAARRDVHAVKVVSRVVEGIAFEPGSHATPEEKVKALRGRLDEVQQSASVLASLVSPDNQGSWVRAQCAEQVAEMIAKRSMRVAAFHDVPAVARAVAETIYVASHDSHVAAIVDMLQDAKYRPAHDGEVAYARIMVSVSAAVWDVYDRVSTVCVLDRPYSFERSPVDIAQMLVAEIHDIAASLAIDVPDRDMQVAHLQGSVRRVASLIGAEYAAQMMRADDFIRAASGAEREARLLALKSRLDAIVGESVRVGVLNFQAIESIAPRLLEESIAREDARNNEAAR